jgi:hypothetical protein
VQFTGQGSPVNYSGPELKNLFGVPVLHNMVRLVVDPHYRHSRLDAARTQDPEALQTSGMVPSDLVRAVDPYPGRQGRKQKDELAFQRRFQRGRQKIERRDERSVSAHRKEQERRKRSIEEMRERIAREGARVPVELSRLEEFRRATAVPPVPL